jgi:pimeloyl-ACP methyl ester carboxylesterase
VTILETRRWGQEGDSPILMLHEGLGSVSMWRDFPAKLADQTAMGVIAYSRQGYGESGSFEDDYALDFMHREADSVVRLMDSVGIDQAHLFGHSDGASIALLAAARYPERIKSLILEAPHVFVEPMCLSAIKALAPQAEPLIERLARHHRDAASVFRQWFTVWTDPGFPEWSIEADIAIVRCPTLIAQGERDEYGTFEQVDRTCALLPQAFQLRLPDCGHSPHSDCERQVLQACKDFYEEFGHEEQV